MQQKKKTNPVLAFALFIVIFVTGIFCVLELARGPINPLPTASNNIIIPSQTPLGTIPTDTPIPLPTETPDTATTLETLADGVVIGEIEEVIENMGALVIRYKMGQDFSGYNVGFAEDEMVHLACVLREAGYTDGNYQFHALVDLADAFGNISLGDGLVVRLMPEAIAAINCENYAIVNLEAIAQYYELAEGLR